MKTRNAWLWPLLIVLCCGLTASVARAEQPLIVPVLLVFTAAVDDGRSISTPTTMPAVYWVPARTVYPEPRRLREGPVANPRARSSDLDQGLRDRVEIETPRSPNVSLWASAEGTERFQGVPIEVKDLPREMATEIGQWKAKPEAVKSQLLIAVIVRREDQRFPVCPGTVVMGIPVVPVTGERKTY